MERRVVEARRQNGGTNHLSVDRRETHGVRKKRKSALLTCRVQFQRPRIVVPLEMIRNFSGLSMSPNIPTYDVCLSTSDCANSMYCIVVRSLCYGGITTTIKLAIKFTIKLKTSPGPARLAQLLQPSLAFCRKLLANTTKC